MKNSSIQNNRYVVDTYLIPNISLYFQFFFFSSKQNKKKKNITPLHLTTSTLSCCSGLSHTPSSLPPYMCKCTFQLFQKWWIIRNSRFVFNLHFKIIWKYFCLLVVLLLFTFIQNFFLINATLSLDFLLW